MPESKKKSASDAPAESRRTPRVRRKKAAEPEKGPKAAKAAKAKEAKAEVRSLEAGRVHVYSLDGDVVKSVDLPTVFQGEVRSDLIRRAVTAAQANRRQPYGPGRRSGAKHSVRWSGKGHGVSRVPRIRGSMTGAQAPGTVGGRRAHPPRVEKVWAKKVNENERRLARNAALAAVKEVTIVSARGHAFKEELSLPVVIEDGIETLQPDGGATQEGVKILDRLGVYADVERAKDGRHVRAGRGKMRGRRYRQPRSLLVVVKDPAKVRRLFGNLPGVEVVSPAGLSAEVLAPGGDPGRLTMFSEGALEVLRSWSP
ncbi:MAG: 50S ribosomal protein L4 [Methanobacteriota archaeon]|nr:MAG: 50S ribosomal protein L4 [Euryarchaeota archaeon]TLZ97291.1 MAG: 50S ribosomal protein L4 [Euryarchaeota archaeon]